jgi:hypothetical protein
MIMVIVPLNMMIIMVMDANAALLPVRSVALYMHPQYSTYTS